MRKLVQGIESGCGTVTTILAMLISMHHKTWITKELIDYGKVSIKIYYNLNF